VFPLPVDTRKITVVDIDRTVIEISLTASRPFSIRRSCQPTPPVHVEEIAVQADDNRVPAAVTTELTATLTEALGSLRTEFRERSEQVLAAEWRAGFADRVTWLDDVECYFKIAHALTVVLDVMEFSGAEKRTQILPHLSQHWMYSVIDPYSKDPDDYGDAILASFDQRGIPRPTQNQHFDTAGQRAAVFGVVASISALHSYLGGGPITDDMMKVLRVLCVAAHAVSAPDSVWRDLEPGTSTQESPDRVAFEWPNDLAEEIVRTEIRLRQQIAAASEQRDRMSLMDRDVHGDLDEGKLSPAIESLLTGAGIDLTNIKALIAHRQEYDRSGLWKRMVMGTAQSDLSSERTRIKKLWRTKLNEASTAVGELTARREQEIKRLAREMDLFAPGPDSLVPDYLRPLNTYVGHSLAKLGVGERAPHTLWTSTVLDDVGWRLPLLANRHPNVVLFTDEKSLPYQQACVGARNMVLDKLSRTAPGQLLLTWIDPVGRGQSAGPFLELLERDKSLIDDKVWSEPDEIATALRKVSDRMSELEQRFLKDTFDDLESYNETAGSLAEPYHIVVVTGFPRGFTEESAQRLRQITEQGARLGISVVTVLEPGARSGMNTTVSKAHPYPVFSVWAGGHTAAMPPWWSNAAFPLGLWVAGHDGRPHAPVKAGPDDFVWTPCEFLEFSPEAASAIVTGYATETAKADAVVIDSGSLAVEQDGDATTQSSVDIPLGVRGRGARVDLQLGKGLSQHVLVGGLPGSGKSTLFHTLITSSARRYSPEELEMYLLDFKQGVEFQPYAEGALPHARVVAVQSERDFGLSVLRGLRDEIDRRAVLFRATGSDHLAEHRGRTGEPLPRVLVVVDEFQVLFAEDDALAHECAKLLDHVVRQGRAFGLHTVLGTQTLRGQGTMSLLRSTLDQVAVRVVLKTGESDSRLFLADDNPAGARLSRPGEAIFNPDGGRPEGNVEFQVALTSDEARDAVVRQAREQADAAGFTRRPLVFDGTRTITVDDDEQVTAWLDGHAAPDRKSIHLHVGLPVAIGGSGAVVLSRRAGRHLAVVHRDAAFATGAALVATVTAVRSSAVVPNVTIVECLGDDEDHAGELRALAAWRGAVTWGRRRKALASTLAAAAAEVRRRIEEDDYGAEPWLVVVNALQRARELDAEPSYDGTGSPGADLLAVLVDGSEVGVHVLVTADSVETIDRRLGPGALDHFGARLLGQCSEDTSQRVLGSAAASRLGAAYALLDEPDDHRRETVRPFPSPSPEWVAAATRD
jgi:hypothetical protein